MTVSFKIVSHNPSRISDLPPEFECCALVTRSSFYHNRYACILPPKKAAVAFCLVVLSVLALFRGGIGNNDTATTTVTTTALTGIFVAQETSKLGKARSLPSQLLSTKNGTVPGPKFLKTQRKTKDSDAATSTTKSTTTTVTSVTAPVTGSGRKPATTNPGKKTSRFPSKLRTRHLPRAAAEVLQSESSLLELSEHTTATKPTTPKTKTLSIIDDEALLKDDLLVREKLRAFDEARTTVSALDKARFTVGASDKARFTVGAFDKARVTVSALDKAKVTVSTKLF